MLTLFVENGSYQEDSEVYCEVRMCHLRGVQKATLERATSHREEIVVASTPRIEDGLPLVWGIWGDFSRWG